MPQSVLDLILRTRKIGTGGKETEKELEGVGKATTGLGLAAKAAVVGGIGLLVAGLKASVDAAMEAERVTAQTEAVIKATGSAAGLTAQEIAKLAESESRLTSIDDEVIQSGANMLLTFKEIGGDVFPRATRAMEDMAVAMAKGDTSAIDLQGTAIQLGKALNDPVKGVTALQRVGVTFTAEQKKTIKTMAAMNDIAGAQALILAELESEFGGAAEAAGKTTAGAMQKLNNAVENLAEVLGQTLLPFLAGAAETATRFFESLGRGINYIKGTATETETLAIALEAASARFGENSVQANFVREQLQKLQETEKSEHEALMALSDDRRDNIQAMRDNQIAAAELIPTEEELEQAEKDAAKAAEEQAEALEKARQASVDAELKFISLSEAMVGIDKAGLARQAIEGLNQALRDGSITAAEHQRAVQAVQLEYGFATEKSIAMAEGQRILDMLLANGSITANSYTQAIALLGAAAEDGDVKLDELGVGAASSGSAMNDAAMRAEQLAGRIRGIPAHTEIEIVTRMVTVHEERDVVGPGRTQPLAGGAQHGGVVAAGRGVRVHPPEMFFPRESGFIMSQADTRRMLMVLEQIAGGLTRPNFNLTYNGAAASPADFGVLRGLAGAF